MVRVTTWRGEEALLMIHLGLITGFAPDAHDEPALHQHAAPGTLLQHWVLVVDEEVTDLSNTVILSVVTCMYSTHLFDLIILRYKSQLGLLRSVQVEYNFLVLLNKAPVPIPRAKCPRHVSA